MEWKCCNKCCCPTQKALRRMWDSSRLTPARVARRTHTVSVWSASACSSKARRHGRATAVALACFLGAFAVCQSPSPQRPVSPISTATCGECHREIMNSYAHAPMRHAMEPPGADPVLEAHPRLSVSRGGYTYTILTKDGKSTYT